MSKTITVKIACKGAGTLALAQMTPLQGAFKILTDENRKRLVREIMTDGFIEPISVWEDPKSATVYILNGHQRYDALTWLKEHGWTDDQGAHFKVKVPQVPVNYVEADDLANAKRKVLALASQYGAVSTQGLRTLIDELGIPAADLSTQFNFPEVDIASIMSGLTVPIMIGHDLELNPLLTERDITELKSPVEIENEPTEDDVPDVPKVATSKTGDIYQLGRHRLMCGDSTSIEDVKTLMDNHVAQMLFTDPPYGVDYSGGIQFDGNGGVKRNNRERLANDSDSSIYSRVMPVVKQVVDGPCYTWFAFTQCRPTVEAIEAIEAIGEMHALIIWHKTNATYAAMNAQYKQRHEPCIYWKPKGSTLRWCGPTDERTIWEIKRDGRNEFHPTQKPVELAERAIRNHDAANVLDLFGGSGSTLIAAEKVGRPCFMMEMEPLYVDVIITRWEEFTGQKAERVASGPTHIRRETT